MTTGREALDVKAFQLQKMRGNPRETELEQVRTLSEAQ
jgi:hypothetical protein